MARLPGPDPRMRPKPPTREDRERALIRAQGRAARQLRRAEHFRTREERARRALGVPENGGGR